MKMQLKLRILDGRYGLAQLPSGGATPDWISGRFSAVISSQEGITVVCDETVLPDDAKAQSGFRCLEIGGVFDLASVGVLAAVIQPLAMAGISVFAYSTWETDYILLQETDLNLAVSALMKAGHAVHQN
jgi:hypothetical protein